MRDTRTDREIAQRLGELLNQQQDLQEQLGTHTGHLRTEIGALAGPDTASRPRRVDLDQVLDLLGRLAVAPTEADAVDVIVSPARQFLPGTRGALSRGDGEREPVVNLGAWDPAEQWHRSYRNQPTESPPQRLSGRVAAGPTGHGKVFPVRGFGLRIGELRVWSEHDEDSRRAEVLHGRAELLARGAGLVLGGMALQRRLRHSTVRDGMTGLFNRRYLIDTLERELHGAQRRDAPVSLLMLDVDNFGAFNDRHGHEAGDHMLEQLAGLLHARFRLSDVCCRYSGERFAVLLPGALLENAGQRGAELVSAIAGLRPNLDGRVLESITVSAGTAVFPEHADNAADLIAAAESGISLARQAGGNTLIAAERG